MRIFAAKCGGHFCISCISKNQVIQESDRTVSIWGKKKDMKKTNNLPSAITIISQNKDYNTPQNIRLKEAYL